MSVGATHFINMLVIKLNHYYVSESMGIAFYFWLFFPVDRGNATINRKRRQTRLNSGLRTCWASAAEKNFSV